MIIAPIGAPAWLAPDYRYAGDDWSGDNALVYAVYEPMLVATDEAVSMPANVPRDLTGCTVTGTLRFLGLSQLGPARPSGNPPGIVTMTGAILGDPLDGIISLSLPAAKTIFPRQDLGEFAGRVLDPRKALLIAQPKVVDADDAAVSVGQQPLFVF